LEKIVFFKVLHGLYLEIEIMWISRSRTIIPAQYYRPITQYP